ncbi:hypothetical protein [Paenibacillus guangzhouensis]|uniref:hypothetical protein n=1 Tax=Paenibacillus guangzhouensis TaxID=1473112 RepID=UPI00126729A6|nr:hypothetical protein [Paenibacillus guangzhouensis]
MIRVYPVTEERIGHLTDRMVCVVTCHGQRFIGRVAGCRNGKLVLYDEDDSFSPSHEHHHEHHEHHHEHSKHEEEHHEKHKKHHKKRKKQHCDHKPNKHKKHKRHKKCSCRNVKTSGFIPNSGIDRRRFFEIDLSLISLLFLLVL